MARAHARPRSFLPAYYCSIASSVCLVVAAIGATFLVIRALWAWSEYSVSSRRLTRSYFLLFVAPFVVLLLLPTTSFIDIPGAQRQLCASTLETQAAGPFGGAMLSVAGLGGAGVCEQPPDQWGSYLLAQAEADGRILNESTGTCAYAESALLNATAGLCRDIDTLPTAPAGLNCSRVFAQGLCGHPGAAQACRESCGFCTTTPDCVDTLPPSGVMFKGYNVTACVQVKNGGGCEMEQGVKVCAATCGTCGGSTGQRRRLDSLTDDLLSQVLSSVPSSPSSIVGANGCVDARTAKPAIDSLAVSLSSGVILGALASVGTQQGGQVLTTLLPAALGLALGAGQGSTLAKLLLPSLRLPAQLAGVVVTIGLPMLCALLAFANQMLGSALATAACLCVIAALTVWIPLGTMRRVGSKQVRGKSLGFLDGAQLLQPIAEQKAVKSLVMYRKYVMYCWLLGAVGFAVAYLVGSPASSALTQAMKEEVYSRLHRAARQGAR